MSSIDYAIFVIIAISALIGIWRGFIREAMSLVIWVAAFWLSYAWAGTFEPYLSSWISDHSLRLVTAFVLLFLGVHVTGFIITRITVALFESIGLGSVNRVAGGGFGVVRGVVVVAVLVLLVGMTPVAEEPQWQQSYMIDLFSDGLAWVKDYYPLDMAAVFTQARN